MNRDRKIALAGSSVAMLLACSASFITALIFMGIGGGVGSAVAPEFHFSIIEPLLCPEEGELVLEEYQDTFTRPGEVIPTSGTFTRVTCVYPDGSEQDKTVQGAGLILGAYFAICFVPLAVISILGPTTLTGLLLRRRKKSESSDFKEIV